MAQTPLLTDKQLETLVRSGPELERMEPQLSPPLRQVMVDLQRNAADAYAAGDWTVPSTGQSFNMQPRASAPELPQAQQALGQGYLASAQQPVRDTFKTLMDELGMGNWGNKLVDKGPPYFTL